MITRVLQKILSGGNLQFDEAMALVEQCEPTTLFQAANDLRRKLHNNRLDLCSIVNAKSGKCSEDCRFCAQSSHYDVAVANYETIDKDTAVSLAKENEEYGVSRFSLVTAGRSVSEKNLLDFKSIYSQLQRETNMALCASMGFLW